MLRRARSLTIGTVATTCVTFSGCGSGAPAGTDVVPSEVRLVTHRDLGGGPGAIVGGRLVIENDCLAFEWIGGGEPQVAVWPRAASVWEVDGTTVVAAAGRVVAAVGQESFFGGGMDYTRAGILDVADAPIPDECLADRYMLITDLRLLPEP
jgi:hypothetical protein